MKKIILGVLIVMSFSCALDSSFSSIEISENTDRAIEEKINKTEIYYSEDFDSLRNIADIINYMQSKIEYKIDSVDTWSSPKEVLNRGYGDCEDFAIVFMNIYYVVTGVKCNLINVLSREVVNGGNVNHSMILLENDRIISPQNGQEYLYYIGYKYSFDLFFIY